jgi:hypothetical protein
MTRDPGWKKFGFGIRDKHPGSATLLEAQSNFSAKLEFKWNAQITQQIRIRRRSTVRSFLDPDPGGLNGPRKQIEKILFLYVSGRLEGFPGAWNS